MYMGKSKSLTIFALAAIMWCGATALPTETKCDSNPGTLIPDLPESSPGPIPAVDDSNSNPIGNNNGSYQETPPPGAPVGENGPPADEAGNPNVPGNNGGSYPEVTPTPIDEENKSSYTEIPSNPGNGTAGNPTENSGKVTKHITLEVLQRMYPEKAKNGCTPPSNDEHPEKAGECLTLDQVIKPLHAAFDMYNIDNAGAQRAVTDIMFYESMGFFYKTNFKNHGQGTFAQLSKEFVRKYVESIPELKAGFEALKGQYTDLESNEALDAILALANGGDYPVQASSWYLSTAENCGTSMMATLAGDTLESYMNYMQNCVHGGDLDKRTAQFKDVLKNVPSKSLG